MAERSAPRVVEIRPADDEHQVLTVQGGGGAYRRRSCGGCPWRTDRVGTFPPQAFVHSARASYDMAGHMFGCHEMPEDRPATCAGFLLRGAEHNLTARMKQATGELDLTQVTDGGHRLHRSYRAMAEANGVPTDHPALRECRDSGGSE